MVKKADIEDMYGLTPIQQGMCFHSQLSPNSGQYIIQIVMDLEALNIKAFTDSWDVLVQRHEVFRTLFAGLGSENPLQVVLKKTSIPWRFEDFSTFSTAKQRQEIEKLLIQDRDRGLLFNRAPLMRCLLVSLGNGKHRFVWTHHHAIVDGWSLQIIKKELFDIYNAICSGIDIPASNAVPFSKYVQWQYSQELKATELFWKEHLCGIGAPILLGIEKSQSGGQVGLPESHSIRLEKDTAESLKRRAKELHVTLNVVLQGLWALLLSRYSGESDVLFGCVIAGRSPSMSEVENVVGPLVNTVPVRITVLDSMEIGEWIKGVHETQNMRSNFEHAPITDIQKWCGIPRGTSFFNSLFVFENYPILRTEKLDVSSSGLAVKEMTSIEKTSYPLTVVIESAGEVIDIRFEHDSDIYENYDVEVLANCYRYLISEFTGNLSAQVNDFELVPREAKFHQFSGRRENHLQLGSNETLHRLFEIQARDFPERVAVSLNTDCITYGELNCRAIAVAVKLNERSISENEIVGVYIERSIEMVIAILGILKSGAAYLPIDESTPIGRVRNLLEDSQVSTILTSSQLDERLGEFKVFLHTMCVDTIEDNSRIIFESKGESESVAAVLYTSGSSGYPKGVLLSHANLVNRVHWAGDVEWEDAKAVYSQKTTLNFVDHITEIFFALTKAIPLVIVPDTVVRDPSLFVAYLQKEEISHMVLVPALLRLLVSQPGIGKLTRLKVVSSSGEALSQSLADSFCSALPWAKLINIYGCTEVSADVSYFVFSDADTVKRENQSEGSEIGLSSGRDGRYVPIGMPVDSCKLLILNKSGKLLPHGVKGELYVGGKCVSKGYINCPVFTSSRFVNMPTMNTDAVFYKTGDFARIRKDGNFEYLGRSDFQIKIRGFRIEPMEVQSAILRCDGISEAVVIGESGVESQVLIAYVVFRASDLQADAEDSYGSLWMVTLKRQLSEQLPDYMVPSKIFRLDKLPLNQNGKLDRSLLPSGNMNAMQENTKNQSLLSEMESSTAAIWCELLNLESVLVDDNFFEIGGHSIMIIQVQKMIADILKIDIEIADLYFCRTLSVLAKRLEDLGLSDQTPETKKYVFMFSELGDYPATIEELYKNSSNFKTIADDCLRVAESYFSKGLTDKIFSSATITTEHTNKSLTSYDELGTFIVEYALSEWLVSIGIHPSKLIGYGVGEIVAACVAQIFSLDHAFLLLSFRAMKSNSPGNAEELELLNTRCIDEIVLNPPCTSIVSCVLGSWLSDVQSIDIQYWLKQDEKAMLFSSGIQEVLSQGNEQLLEVGLGSQLTDLVKMHGKASSRKIIPIINHEKFISSAKPSPRMNEKETITL